MYTHTHTRTNTLTCNFTHKYTYTYYHIYNACTHTCTHTRTCPGTGAGTNAYKHTYTYTYTYRYPHTYEHEHIGMEDLGEIALRAAEGSYYLLSQNGVQPGTMKRLASWAQQLLWNCKRAVNSFCQHLRAILVCTLDAWARMKPLVLLALDPCTHRPATATSVQGVQIVVIGSLREGATPLLVLHCKLQAIAAKEAMAASELNLDRRVMLTAERTNPSHCLRGMLEEVPSQVVVIIQALQVGCCGVGPST